MAFLMTRTLLGLAVAAFVAWPAPGAGAPATQSQREGAPTPPVVHRSAQRIRGRVAEAGTGRSVAGATVRVRGPVDRTVVSDEAGLWSTGPLPVGEYTVSTDHFGYGAVERRLRLPGTGEPVVLLLTPLPLELDALVVTAGRRVQRLSEAPVATELVSQREIRQTGASDLASVLTERTGVELEGGHPVGAGVMIQGMGSERVLVMMDGQPFIGRISGKIDISRIPTSMIERIEIVKGPQSTLYGSEAMGGVVNIITRAPRSSAWTTALAATAGDQGRFDVSGNAVGGAGPITGLVDVGRRSVERTPGWSGEEGARSVRWDALGKVAWRTPWEGTTAEATAVLLDEAQRWRSGQLHYFADNTQWSGRLSGTVARGSHRIQPTVYLTAFDHLSRSASSATPGADGASETQRLVEGEVLYGWTVGRHAVDGGLEARRELVRSDRLSGGRRTEATVEAFLQTTLSWRGMTLVPGLRGSRSDPWGTHWTPRVAAMVRPVPDLAIRVSAGEGFRAPSFKERYMTFLNVGPGYGYTVRGNPALGPEVSRNLTASVEWAGKGAYVRVQAFRNRFEDFIETRVVGDSSGVAVYTYGNVDHGFTRGGEIEVGTAWRGWRGEAGYSVLRAEHSETGEPLLGRPEGSVRGTLGYANPVGLRLSVTGVRTGRTPLSHTEAGTAWRDPFTRFDVRLAQELPGNLSLTVGVDNVLDARVDEWSGFTGRHVYTTLSWRPAGENPFQPDHIQAKE